MEQTQRQSHDAAPGTDIRLLSSEVGTAAEYPTVPKSAPKKRAMLQETRSTKRKLSSSFELLSSCRKHDRCATYKHAQCGRCKEGGAKRSFISSSTLHFRAKASLSISHWEHDYCSTPPHLCTPPPAHRPKRSTTVPGELQQAPSDSLQTPAAEIKLYYFTLVSFHRWFTFWEVTF